jgi:hypothetical protein
MAFRASKGAPTLHDRTAMSKAFQFQFAPPLAAGASGAPSKLRG